MLDKFGLGFGWGVITGGILASLAFVLMILRASQENAQQVEREAAMVEQFLVGVEGVEGVEDAYPLTMEQARRAWGDGDLTIIELGAVTRAQRSRILLGQHLFTMDQYEALERLRERIGE